MAFETRKTKFLFTLPNINNFDCGQQFTLNQSCDDEDDNCKGSNVTDDESVRRKLTAEEMQLNAVDAPLKHDEAKILNKAYELFRKDGKLTKKEIELLEGMDEILEAAKIVVDMQTGDARITSDKGDNKLADFIGEPDQARGGIRPNPSGGKGGK